jgi:hypothetical protein
VSVRGHSAVKAAWQKIDAVCREPSATEFAERPQILSEMSVPWEPPGARTGAEVRPRIRSLWTRNDAKKTPPSRYHGATRMRRRAFITGVAASAANVGAYGIGAVWARTRAKAGMAQLSPPIEQAPTLLSAPIELAGDWGHMLPRSAAT